MCPRVHQAMKETTSRSGLTKHSAEMTAFVGWIHRRLHENLHALNGTRLKAGIAFSEIHAATRSIVKHSHTFIAGSPIRRRCTHVSRPPNIPFDILFPMSSLQACIWAIVRRHRTVERVRFLQRHPPTLGSLYCFSLNRSDKFALTVRSVAFTFAMPR